MDVACDFELLSVFTDLFAINLFLLFQITVHGFKFLTSFEHVKYTLILLEFYSLPIHPNFMFPYQELAITSDEALSLDELPKRAVILGGGCVDMPL